MEEQDFFKDYIKTKVIFKITLLYLPAIFFTLYFDVLISALILGINDFYRFVYLFSFPWREILSVLIVQYMVCCFFVGLYIGLRKTLIRNKDFFLN